MFDCFRFVLICMVNYFSASVFTYVCQPKVKHKASLL